MVMVTSNDDMLYARVKKELDTDTCDEKLCQHAYEYAHHDMIKSALFAVKK